MKAAEVFYAMAAAAQRTDLDVPPAMLKQAAYVVTELERVKTTEQLQLVMGLILAMSAPVQEEVAS